MKLYIVCAILLSMFGWCTEDVYDDILSIEVENNTDEPVIIDDGKYNNYEIFQPNDFNWWPDRMYIIYGHEKKCISLNKTFNEKESENGNIQILLWKQSTLDRYSQEEIMQKNIYDKHYKLTYSDFKCGNNKIVYNGE